VSKYYENADAVVYHGNCLDELKNLEDNSIDAVVTDPPYELGFMGKKWDNTGIAYNVDVWRECLRVLKPGGHLLAFGGTRTWHRLAVAIEDAGFEVRDSIAWIYGSGFPKSHNISKAIDKLHGAEREVVGRNPNSRENATKANTLYESGTVGKTDYITEAATDDAKKWDGWGTALKPAHEPIVVARKPLIGTVAENVLQYGTGGLNIDASRIDFADTETDSRIGTDFVSNNGDASNNANDNQVPNKHYVQMYKTDGRWPANIILDEYTAELLDEQSGASRFFYVAKANKKDRNEGLDALPDHDWSGDGAAIPERANRPFIPSKNHHPTVKPTSLMTYLIKLVTPPNGIVLDPFTGSGSTGKAAIRNGFRFVGIELTEEYLPIITTRLDHEIKQKTEDLFSE
jgi:DNA modification methylase